jgi:hypothetical protein
MLLSALVMLVFGLALSFAPAELVRAASGSSSPPLVVLAQTCGALYLGFAMLNWMAKDNLIGGIYSRPVAMGNFVHFFAVAMALLKAFASLPKSVGSFALIVIDVLLAVGFGLVLFQHPKTN